MGNAASQPGTPSAAGTPAPSQTTASQPSAIPRSASQPVGATSVPISVSAPAGGASGSATERLAFHSGLTPPTSPPSPPPPGTPQLLPHGGHMSPQNPHALSLPQAHDFSKGTVTRLILEAKLAPFYRGIEDFEEDWTLDEISEEIEKIREKDYEEGVANSVTERIKEERAPASASTGTVGSLAKKMGASVKGHSTKNDVRSSREKEERAAQLDREKRAYLNATECPICFLSYPPNINTSRCCQQPICTECFVQIKRSDATTTHLESEPACCPFCMETDFGVIYERPSSPVPAQRTLSGAGAVIGMGDSALSTSPEAGTSGISQVMNLGMDGADAELSVGPGMPPKVQESVRRKSVSHKDKQVVTIDEIRPDWEVKLNTVKAAAARRAARRIVMRQVGDKLIPIGYTSSRAPATADFSMSTGGEEGSRRRRAGTNRERDLEELMLLEAMRLSMIDHEDHQRKMHDDAKRGGVPAPGDASVNGGSGASTPRDVGSSSGGGFGSGSGGGGIFRKRAGTEGSNTSGKGAAAKLLSKLGNRSRSNSAASKNGEAGASTASVHRVSFADQHRPSIGSQASQGSGSQLNLSQGSGSPRVRPSASTGAGDSSSSLVSATAGSTTGGSPGLDGAVGGSSFSPTSMTTPASPSSPLNPRHSTNINTSVGSSIAAAGSGSGSGSVPGSAVPPVNTVLDVPTPVLEQPEPLPEPLPRLSADMPPLVPDKVGVPTVATGMGSTVQMQTGTAGSKRGSVASASHVERMA